MEKPKFRPGSGFTILELCSAIVVLGILIVLSFPAITGVQDRVAKVRCVANLRSLYAGAALYVQQNGSWPQIDPNMLGTDKLGYSKAWIAALKPTGIEASGWICPTVQRNAGGPDYTDEKFIRLDYIPMPFDSKAITPYRWPSQPWFVENNDVHGNGNLLIFTDGSIRELNDVKKSPPRNSQ